MLYADERPQTFDEVRGQEFIIKNLQSQAKKGVFFNSIILCGKYGTGKTTVARIIARAANCENRDENGNPCMECASCRSILDRSGTDVIEIDGASNNGVDAARKLMKEINYIPMSKYRVIIIDECHRISSSAWDALLKTLEEPPKHVLFILCTTDETALPETIRSRAPIYRFESLPAGLLSRHAKETAKKHGIKIPDNALNLLASYADGSMRNVLSLLEQISMQGKDITESDVEMLLGINHYTFTVEFISGMLSGNLNICMERLNILISEGRSVRLFAKDLMRTAVDMVLQKTGITPDNGNTEYLKLLGEETAKHSMAQLNSLAEATAVLEKGMQKESDTYAMYGGIIGAVRKLQQDAPRKAAAEAPKTTARQTGIPDTMQEGLSSEKTAEMVTLPKQEPDTGGPGQEESHADSSKGDGINRNISVMPDLERALMDFMPDLKREPQGRFDAGIPSSTDYEEDISTPDSTDSMETDTDMSGQYGDYRQTFNGNGFMPDSSTEYPGFSDTADDAYEDVTDSHEDGGYGWRENAAEGGTVLTDDTDDFDRRWEEARKNSAQSSKMPMPVPKSPVSAKGANIFGIPLGFGIPDMDRKRSFT